VPDHALRGFAADFKRGKSGRRGQIFLFENEVAFPADNLEGEVVEARAQVAVGTIVDDNGVDGELGAEVNFPPGVGFPFGGMGLAAVDSIVPSMAREAIPP